MSSEKTADMFKDKSEEEIINWMIKNMSPEQIKSCFEGDMPVQMPEPAGPAGPAGPTVNDLRKMCADKRYVIHKVEGNKVYFWYYLVKKQVWQYSITSMDDFPKAVGQEAEECGEDTAVESSFADELKTAYNQNVTDPNEKFEPYNKGENEYTIFNEVKEEYKQQGLNLDWIDTLLTALHIQQSVPVLGDERTIINYAPVLIESVTSTKVNYYYLVNDQGELRFVEANLLLEKFRDDLLEIVDDLNLQIAMPGEAAAASAKTPDEWKQAIRQAANDIYPADLERVKEIYDKFPLSAESKYFMKGLLVDNEFGTYGNMGKCGTVSHNVTSVTKDYVKNKFGARTAELFSTKVITNNFGTQTIALTAK